MSMLATGANTGNRMTGGGLGKERIPKGMEKATLNQFTPEQMDLFRQMFGHLGPESFLSRLAGGEEGAFQESEAPAYGAFQSQMGQLGSRFSGMGAGARKSSGFQLAGSQAASDFAQNLASNRQGLQRQALMDMMNMSQMLMGQRPQDTFLAPKQSPWWESLITGIGGGIGKGIGGGAAGGWWK